MRRLFVVVAITAALLFLPRIARADAALQLILSPGVTWTRETPSMPMDQTSTYVRDIPKTNLPTRGGLASIGGYLDTQITFGDRNTMPLFGFGMYGAVGSYDGITTSADGSIVRLRPWTAMRYDVLLPGVGARWKHRRWMFETGIRTGIAVLGMRGSVAIGADSRRVDPVGVSFLLMGQASVCRRLDPWQRLCIEVAPRLYDFGFLNGATAGLRYEWGM